MSDARSRAVILFDRTARFHRSDLETQFGAASVVDYRRFLAIEVLDEALSVGPRLRHGPGSDVDAVWHSHLLRPSHYVAVCARS